PRTPRVGAAQVFIIRKLHARGWRRGMVENYLGLSLTQDVWRSMTFREEVKT
ncbi:MAG: hypothetical protein JWM36_1125, partial [Hyphomicrobiales bacterium]|nr:hypothetical protein [Hyphomicrobiales bacterium]